MIGSPAPVATISALLGLFLGGAAAGVGLAGTLASDSWLAETVSFFALPVAFAAGLQAWYGLALLSLVARLLRWLSGSSPPPAGGRRVSPGLSGSLVFLPLSSGAGAGAGLLAWRLARRGVLLPPESI
jgi:hypothetical protein